MNFILRFITEPAWVSQVFKEIEQEFNNSRMGRQFADWINLFFCSMTPSDLSMDSKGLCVHVPFIEDVVDFDKIKDIKPDFYINTYNITDHKMDVFSKGEITPDHFHASLAFPFIYPFFKLNNKYYIEGSAVDAINYKGLIDNHPEVKTIIVFDVLGNDKLIQEPRNLYDAWVKSIIVPLTEIAISYWI